MKLRGILNPQRPLLRLTLAMAGCIAVVVLVECDGLAHWADNLEVGPLRSVAVPATHALQSALQPLGFGHPRQEALESLARVGWSDDPALVARVNAPNKPAAAAAPDTASGTAAGAPNPLVPKNQFLNAPGSQAPLAADVPHTVVLSPLPAVEQGKTRVVALAGDSMMAVGLSATLMREVVKHPHLKIVKAFRSGTGLARPEVFNWMDEYQAMLGNEKPDVVLVAIGANDAQNFVVNGKVLAFGSEDWTHVYQQRVASYLAMISSTGARVVWVGLPPMRSAVYDEKIAKLNRITYSVVSQAKDATWWNSVSYIGDAQGHFREFMPSVKGGATRLRAPDGIHLSDEGAGLLTAVLLPWMDPVVPGSKPEEQTPKAAQSPHKVQEHVALEHTKNVTHLAATEKHSVRRSHKHSVHAGA